MNLHHVDAYGKIPQPAQGVQLFTEELKKPTPRYYIKETDGPECMADGALLQFDPEAWENFPETAVESLRRVFDGKEIRETEDGYPITMVKDDRYDWEEYRLEVTPEGTRIAAADAEGLRRGIYAFEDKLCEAPGRHTVMGQWQAKPFVKHRISRCFFGPTYRPPNCIDEMTNDIDYYPEGYLDRLAHEGVNGLWLYVYFKDVPSSLFPENGKDWEKRVRKLRETARRCGRYGIKIYIFFSEPKYFGLRDRTYTDEELWKSYCVQELDAYPGVASWIDGDYQMACTSNEITKRYLQESMDCLFRNVPELGGAINIMLGEDTGSCISMHVIHGHRPGMTCPVCAAKGEAEAYRELARMYTDTMRKYNPNAEFIGWFYAPWQRDDSDFHYRLLEVAKKWPDDSTILFNFESGGGMEQLGKERIIFDYSLAYVGPSKLFNRVTKIAKKTGAKLQVGCSHEDASVPFIPVPENLYDKYKFMYENGVTAAMQCWYFGNYPGLMNQAAGKLSFTPFPADAQTFLVELAKPLWRQDAPVVAKAWHEFSMAYRQFPANLSFEWYGPLHNSIAWPWYLYPVDRPMCPTWLLNFFPLVNGDRFGENIGFHHTIREARELCFTMWERWRKGLTLLESVQDHYLDDPERLADIRLAQAVGLQMESTANMLQFYLLREDMLYQKQDNLAEMKQLVLEEISNTEEMCALCEKDPRLGYHSEAEGYLFYPEKLKARKALLEELLEDFETFDLNAEWVDAYTGKKPEGKVAYCGQAQQMEGGFTWTADVQNGELTVLVTGSAGKRTSVRFEPVRMSAALRVDVDPNGAVTITHDLFPSVPDIRAELLGADVKLYIPLKPFEGFIREGFPVRINVFGDGFAWCDPKPWKRRLMHGTYNPEGTGWLNL